MLSVLSKFVLGSLFTTTVVAGGCQSGAGSASTDGPATQPAIACEKCKTTWTKAPYSFSNPRSPQRVIGYRSTANHECPECRDVATKMVRHGKAIVPGKPVHQCKLCGGEMKVCHVD